MTCEMVLLCVSNFTGNGRYFAKYVKISKCQNENKMSNVNQFKQDIDMLLSYSFVFMKNLLKTFKPPPPMFFCEPSEFFRTDILKNTWRQLILYCHLIVISLLLT